jgi:hypothetical protein
MTKQAKRKVKQKIGKEMIKARKQKEKEKKKVK